MGEDKKQSEAIKMFGRHIDILEGNLCFGKWYYIAKFQRICTKCGQCQYYIHDGFLDCTFDEMMEDKIHDDEFYKRLNEEAIVSRMKAKEYLKNKLRE